MASSKVSQMNRFLERIEVVELQKPLDLKIWEHELKVKCNKNDHKDIIDCIHRFIQTTISYVSNKKFQEQIFLSRKSFLLMKDIIKEDWRSIFAKSITRLIFDIIIEESAECWCIKKELLKIFNHWMQRTKKSIRHEAVRQLSQMYLFKMIDNISSIGDYDLQLTIIETIFRMYGRSEISARLKELIPESEELSKTFAEINPEKFDEDCRIFLNTFNQNYEKIFSIVCGSVLIGNDFCQWPFENINGLWVDFNLNDKAISWYQCTIDNSDVILELITLFISELKNVLVEKKSNSDTIFIHFKLSGQLISSLEEKQELLNRTKNVTMIIEKSTEADKLLEDILPKVLGNLYQSSQTPSKKISTAKRLTYKSLNVKISKSAQQPSIIQSKSEISSIYNAVNPLNKAISIETKSLSSNKDHSTSLFSRKFSVESKDTTNSELNKENFYDEELNNTSNMLNSNSIQILSGRCSGHIFDYHKITHSQKESTLRNQNAIFGDSTRSCIKISKNKNSITSKKIKASVEDNGFRNKNATTAAANLPKVSNNQESTSSDEWKTADKGLGSVVCLPKIFNRGLIKISRSQDTISSTEKWKTADENTLQDSNTKDIFSAEKWKMADEDSGYINQDAIILGASARNLNKISEQQDIADKVPNLKKIVQEFHSSQESLTPKLTQDCDSMEVILSQSNHSNKENINSKDSKKTKKVSIIGKEKSNLDNSIEFANKMEIINIQESTQKNKSKYFSQENVSPQVSHNIKYIQIEDKPKDVQQLDISEIFKYKSLNCLDTKPIAEETKHKKITRSKSKSTLKHVKSTYCEPDKRSVVELKPNDTADLELNREIGIGEFKKSPEKENLKCKIKKKNKSKTILQKIKPRTKENIIVESISLEEEVLPATEKVSTSRKLKPVKELNFMETIDKQQHSEIKLLKKSKGKLLKQHTEKALNEKNKINATNKEPVQKQPIDKNYEQLKTIYIINGSHILDEMEFTTKENASMLEESKLTTENNFHKSQIIEDIACQSKDKSVKLKESKKKKGKLINVEYNFKSTNIDIIENTVKENIFDDLRQKEVIDLTANVSILEKSEKCMEINLSAEPKVTFPMEEKKLSNAAEDNVKSSLKKCIFNEKEISTLEELKPFEEISKNIEIDNMTQSESKPLERKTTKSLKRIKGKSFKTKKEKTIIDKEDLKSKNKQEVLDLTANLSTLESKNKESSKISSLETYIIKEKEFPASEEPKLSEEICQNRKVHGVTKSKSNPKRKKSLKRKKGKLLKGKKEKLFNNEEDLKPKNKESIKLESEFENFKETYIDAESREIEEIECTPRQNVSTLEESKLFEEENYMESNQNLKVKQVVQPEVISLAEKNVMPRSEKYNFEYKSKETAPPSIIKIYNINKPTQIQENGFTLSEQQYSLRKLKLIKKIIHMKNNLNTKLKKVSKSRKISFKHLKRTAFTRKSKKILNEYSLTSKNQENSIIEIESKKIRSTIKQDDKANENIFMTKNITTLRESHLAKDNKILHSEDKLLNVEEDIGSKNKETPIMGTVLKKLEQESTIFYDKIKEPCIINESNVTEEKGVSSLESVSILESKLCKEDNCMETHLNIVENLPHIKDNSVFNESRKITELGFTTIENVEKLEESEQVKKENQNIEIYKVPQSDSKPIEEKGKISKIEHKDNPNEIEGILKNEFTKQELQYSIVNEKYGKVNETECYVTRKKKAVQFDIHSNSNSSIGTRDLNQSVSTTLSRRSRKLYSPNDIFIINRKKNELEVKKSKTVTENKSAHILDQTDKEIEAAIGKEGEGNNLEMPMIAIKVDNIDKIMKETENVIIDKSSHKKEKPKITEASQNIEIVKSVPGKEIIQKTNKIKITSKSVNIKKHISANHRLQRSLKKKYEKLNATESPTIFDKMLESWRQQMTSKCLNNSGEKIIKTKRISDRNLTVGNEMPKKTKKEVHKLTGIENAIKYLNKTNNKDKKNSKKMIADENLTSGYKIPKEEEIPVIGKSHFDVFLESLHQELIGDKNNNKDKNKKIISDRNLILSNKMHKKKLEMSYSLSLEYTESKNNADHLKKCNDENKNKKNGRKRMNKNKLTIPKKKKIVSELSHLDKFPNLESSEDEETDKDKNRIYDRKIVASEKENNFTSTPNAMINHNLEERNNKTIYNLNIESGFQNQAYTESKSILNHINNSYEYENIDRKIAEKSNALEDKMDKTVNILNIKKSSQNQECDKGKYINNYDEDKNKKRKIISDNKIVILENKKDVSINTSNEKPNPITEINDDKIVIISNIELDSWKQNTPIKRFKIDEDNEGQRNLISKHINKSILGPNSSQKPDEGIKTPKKNIYVSHIEIGARWIATAFFNNEVVTIDSNDYIGKYLVILFYPLDFCMLPYAEAPVEILSIDKNYEKFRQLNTEVVGCSVESYFTHKAWLNDVYKRDTLKFPLISDMNQTISRSYRIYSEKLGHSFRGYFIINTEGNVICSTITEITVPILIDEIIQKIKCYQSNLCM